MSQSDNPIPALTQRHIIASALHWNIFMDDYATAAWLKGHLDNDTYADMCDEGARRNRVASRLPTSEAAGYNARVTAYNRIAAQARAQATRRK